MSARAIPSGLVVVSSLVLAGGVAPTGCKGVATSLSGRPGPEAGLLRGLAPAASDGVRHPTRLTDGITAALGDPIRTDLTAAFERPGAFVTYDLGAATPIDCAAITADARGRYLLASSEDGVAFLPLWTVPPGEGGGMQPRLAQELGGRGRFLRLSREARGGEAGAAAVAELSVAGPCPVRWPPPLARQPGTPVEEDARTKAWLFGALTAAFILVYRKKAPDFVKLLVALPLGFAIALAVALGGLWPPSAELWATLMAVLGTVALAAGARVAAGRLWSRRQAKASSPGSGSS